MPAHPEDPHKARTLTEDRRIDYITAVASMVGTRFWKGSAPQVVGIPLVSKRSLTP